MVLMTLMPVITSWMLPSTLMRDLSTRRKLMMNREGFDTIVRTQSLIFLLTHLLTLSFTNRRQVKVNSLYECPCALNHDTEVSLQDYMRLPVDQYVCIKMPLDATLTRVENSKVENRFDLVVPPGNHSPTHSLTHSMLWLLKSYSLTLLHSSLFQSRCLSKCQVRS